jgi:hypothetical protein
MLGHAQIVQEVTRQGVWVLTRPAVLAVAVRGM